MLELPKDERHLEENEDPPIASGPAEMSVATPAGPHKQEPNEKTGSIPDGKICLLCLVTIVLVAIVVGLSIHVSQIRQSLKRMNSDLRQQFTEMETKYRSVNETKAQICELLTSRREQNCSQYWIGNEGGCYFISTFKFSYDKARLYCSDSHSKLLEINSAEEENFVVKADRDKGISYWIGKCKDG
ncbi:oxidized low-density lipoprotein receptor 1-like [Hemitrygon akajei]|uniref:oxidized low-density lipoprotein receptor 1-like n=1 Tax=Hemitrygon akajei TaxID=2704970 RepID=UPI003BF9D926